ncbi:MAG: hypothetical protein HeimC3_10320 [Candidatus Heimdallarchaeota archaeon LC_3]|nr:MAG: hypothetical protein HeimC3_10320 [Candidatus Heimdallarchaeota archaeon LC_3]
MTPKREIKEKILKNHQVDKGELGIYDLRNRLNDLTGKQWTFSTRSVVTKLFSNNYPKDWLFKYPGILPLQLINNLFQTFTKENSSIYDPYAFLGNSFFVKLKLGIKQNFFYSNLQPDKMKILLEENNEEKFNRISSSNCDLLPDKSVDLLFSQAIVNFEQSLSVLKEDFVRNEYKNIFNAFFSNTRVLKDEKYAILTISNWILKENSNNTESYFDTTTEIISKLEGSELVPKGEIIWSQPHKSISGLNDTRIWIFRKEN